MSLILDGTNGLSDVDGTAGTPAIRGSDANTGVFFGTDIVGVSTGGSERVRVNASGNVGIGTGSPAAPLQVNGASGSVALIVGNTGETTRLEVTATSNVGATLDITDGGTNRNMLFAISGTERARIDTSGNLLVGTTSSYNAKLNILTTGGDCITTRPSSNISYSAVSFQNSSGSFVGAVAVSTTNTSYQTSSDYRLKENIAPMTGALAKVAALRPCTYVWKSTGEADEGFIAHELAEVCPSAVVGEKDAVNEDGSIKPQGIDTSFLVATLTAAIQEQQAIIESLTARVVALEQA